MPGQTCDPSPPQQLLADWVRRDYSARTREAAAENPEVWRRRDCRACHSQSLVEVLSLGTQPPANAFVHADQLPNPEPRFPLDLMLCEDCGMVQLGHVVPPELLFRAYSFFTSMSARMTEHFSRLMTEAAHEFVPPGGLIVEIGSNDGTGLSSVQRRDVRVLGIDPARNVSVMAASRGVPTIAEFFSEPLACEITRVAGSANLIVGCNVLGHIDNLDEVCRGIRELLAPGGAFIFEVPYLGDLIDHTEFDTIYHEHLSCFAIRPLVTLFNRHDLRLERIQHFPVHGGTIRGTVVVGSGCSQQVQDWIERELARGLGRRAVFETLNHKVESLCDQLREWLVASQMSGQTVWGYGAPAKGTVLLNYCGIDTSLLPVVVDSTSAKQGLHVPGTHQPILPPAKFLEGRPDAVLILAWNHAAEIVGREAVCRTAGIRFFTPDLSEL